MQLAELEKEHGQLGIHLFELADQIPNVTHPSVPVEEPEVLKFVGHKPQFLFTPRSHIELGKARS